MPKEHATSSSSANPSSPISSYHLMRFKDSPNELRVPRSGVTLLLESEITVSDLTVWTSKVGAPIKVKNGITKKITCGPAWRSNCFRCIGLSKERLAIVYEDEINIINSATGHLDRIIPIHIPKRPRGMVELHSIGLSINNSYLLVYISTIYPAKGYIVVVDLETEQSKSIDAGSCAYIKDYELTKPNQLIVILDNPSKSEPNRREATCDLVVFDFDMSPESIPICTQVINPDIIIPNNILDDGALILSGWSNGYIVLQTESRIRPWEPFESHSKPDTMNLYVCQLESNSNGVYQLRKIKDICSTIPPFEKRPRAIPLCDSIIFVEHTKAFLPEARLIEFSLSTLTKHELILNNQTINYEIDPIVFSNFQLGIYTSTGKLAICNLASVESFYEQWMNAVNLTAENKLPKPIMGIIAEYADANYSPMFFPSFPKPTKADASNKLELSH